jgi:hypothetical protein
VGSETVPSTRIPFVQVCCAETKDGTDIPAAINHFIRLASMGRSASWSKIPKVAALIYDFAGKAKFCRRTYRFFRRVARMTFCVILIQPSLTGLHLFANGTQHCVLG